MMDEQNRDDFYEGPPLEESEHWHDGALFEERAERDARDAEPLTEVETPEGGVYPMPEVIERPHSARAGLAPTALTRDPSLSRAVDRDAAGLPPEAAGYDRSAEGPTPGPLEPPADDVAPDSEQGPGGQWGSSG